MRRMVEIMIFPVLVVLFVLTMLGRLAEVTGLAIIDWSEKL